MKKISYLLLFLLSIIAYACAEEDHPYVGYIVVEDAVVPAQGGTTTVTANTDLSSPITLELAAGDEDWCTVTSNGKEITVTATKPNPNPDSRKATVTVKCGYRVESFTVIQQYNGQEYWHDWTGWTATGSDAHSEGGGYPSLFIDNQTTYWHNDYSNNQPTHWLLIDMKKELPIGLVRIGRRAYGTSNYPSVKTMEIWTSTDNVNFTKAGEFTFALPWTAPDGTVVNGNSAKVPAFEDVKFASIVTARYVRLDITATNNTTGVCQVAYFKAYKQAF